MTKEDMASELAKGRTEPAKQKVREYVDSLWSQGCTCWHSVMRQHVQKHFEEIEKQQTSIPKKEKVTSLSKAVLLKEIREFYIARGKQDLVFDTTRHGGMRNHCDLHKTTKA